MEGTAKLELRDDLAGNDPKRLHLLGLEDPWLAIDDAERAEAVPVGVGEGVPGVKANARLVGHQWIGGKAVVTGRVRHDECLGAQNRVCAECELTRGLGGVESNPRLEPLPVAVDQAHQSDGRLADPCSQLGEIVEVGLRRGVQHAIGAQGFEPSGLVGGQRRRPRERRRAGHAISMNRLDRSDGQPIGVSAPDLRPGDSPLSDPSHVP